MLNLSRAAAWSRLLSLEHVDGRQRHSGFFESNPMELTGHEGRTVVEDHCKAGTQSVPPRVNRGHPTQ